MKQDMQAACIIFYTNLIPSEKLPSRKKIATLLNSSSLYFLVRFGLAKLAFHDTGISPLGSWSPLLYSPG